MALRKSPASFKLSKQHQRDRKSLENRPNLPHPPASQNMTLEELGKFRTCICTKKANGYCDLDECCPYSHCLSWHRRNPFAYAYRASLCPNVVFCTLEGRMRVKSHCLRGRQCMFAHTKEEQMYHPLVYKTQLCRLWPVCSKQFCPFAHGLAELRNPDTVPFSPVQGPEILEVQGPPPCGRKETKVLSPPGPTTTSSFSPRGKFVSPSGSRALARRTEDDSRKESLGRLDVLYDPLFPTTTQILRPAAGGNRISDGDLQFYLGGNGRSRNSSALYSDVASTASSDEYCGGQDRPSVIFGVDGHVYLPVITTNTMMPRRESFTTTPKEERLRVPMTNQIGWDDSPLSSSVSSPPPPLADVGGDSTPLLGDCQVEEAVVEILLQNPNLLAMFLNSFSSSDYQ